MLIKNFEKIEKVDGWVLSDLVSILKVNIEIRLLQFHSTLIQVWLGTKSSVVFMRRQNQTTAQQWKIAVNFIICKLPYNYSVQGFVCVCV